MLEIGGYIELDRYNGRMLHEDGILLNCGRHALIYLIYARKIKKLLLPKFMCDSIAEACKRFSEGKLFSDYWNLEIRYYSVLSDFMPEELNLSGDEWLYVVDFYGQLGRENIQMLKTKYDRVIVDYAQNYFAEPISGMDSVYTCRKFFGVADGAVLYTDANIAMDLPQDESYNRMLFLHGRYERTASEFYAEYVNNNDMFLNEPVKRMSKLTYNLLHAIDYDSVKACRTANFRYLHEHLKAINKLELKVPEGAFMYPLYIDNGQDIRKKLQSKKIYVPTLWPDVFDLCNENDLEYDMAMNILPLPIDQRYGEKEMEKIIQEIKNG